MLENKTKSLVGHRCRAIVKITEMKIVNNQTENSFFNYQNQLKDMRKIVNTALITDYQIDFIPNSFKMSLASIGLIEFKEMLNTPLSKILSSSKEIENLMKLCEFSSSDALKLLYRGSEHGFSAIKFHEKCDNHTNTLTIIKSSNGYIFGGYTTQTWNATSGWKTDPYAFIISFRNKNDRPAKINIHKPQYAIACLEDYSTCFGGGHDICVASNANLNMLSFSNLSNQYYSVAAYTNDPINFLAGSYYFQIDDIEVFQVV